ncbi:MAG TPA: uroporphyrinogen-III synthase [Burkholderiales bacterium]|nr:uroporphyrinogen-III synthase [Burkholderiales bacterium]
MKAKRIAILEARMGKQLVELITQRGGVAYHAPALAELPDLDAGAIERLVRSLQAQPPKLAVFQTGVGTRALFDTTDRLGITQAFLAILDQTIVAARGPKPTGALRSRGVRIDRSAGDPFTTHEILDAVADVDVNAARVIVQRYGSVNAELDRALEARGAEVVEIPTYRWSLPKDTQPLAGLIAALERHEMDAAVFTNAEQVRNLFVVAGQLGKTEALRKALNATLVASIGPVASAALRDAQVAIGVEAKPPKLGALLSSLEAALA